MGVPVALGRLRNKVGPGRSGLLSTEVLMHVRPRQTSTSRSRTCERPPSLAKVAFTVCALTAATIGLVPAAHAQLQNAPVDLEIFRPAMDSKGFVTVNSSAVLGQWDISFGLVTSYARRPLQLHRHRHVRHARADEHVLRRHPGPPVAAGRGRLPEPPAPRRRARHHRPDGHRRGAEHAQRHGATAPRTNASGRSPTRAWATSRSTPSCAS